MDKNYVENGKISSRQTMRLYMFDLMGIATLLLPPYLTRLCGTSAGYAILAGSGLGYIYLLYLGWIMKRMSADVVTYLKENTSTWLQKSVLGLVGFHSIITAGFCAYVFANLMKYSLVEDSSYVVILFLIVVVAAYAVSGGIESRARVYEVLFWIVLLPFFPMMFASVKNMKWRYLESVFVFEGANFGKGVYLVFILLTPLFFLLFLTRENGKLKAVSLSVLFSSVILLGSYVILLGNFGVDSLSELRFPIVTLMSTIQFEGNFLKRMDALMLSVWFFTLYALLNLHFHYGVAMFNEVTGTVKKWKIVFPTVLVFLAAYGMYMRKGWLEGFFVYYAYFAVPFMVFMPCLILCFRRKIDENL